jgi:putative ABC transport system substrate-binding protein
VRRRAFITLLGGAAAWPLAVRAQQAPPVIGFLDRRSPEAMADRLRAFRRGLKDTAHGETETVSIIERWAENKMERLPDLAAELVRRKVAVIVASGGSIVALAAKSATTTIPIVFIVGEDPVGLGLVTSLARPGGNLTGINVLNSELVAKQMEFLRELAPRIGHVAVFVNPANAAGTQSTMKDAEQAARLKGLQIDVLRASNSQEIDTAFATFTRSWPDAVFVGNDAFFASRRVQLVQLAAHHRVLATYTGREFTEIGGLMSYGANIADAYRHAGMYTGRILKGITPADLPVVQASKFEMVINHQTARNLGLVVPPSLLAIADEVIE